MSVIEPVKSHKSSTDQFKAQESEAAARAKIQTAQDSQMRPNAAWFNAANTSTNGITATSALGVVEAKNATPQTTSTASDASSTVTSESVARKEIPENLRDYPQHIQAHFLLSTTSSSNTISSSTSSETSAQSIQVANYSTDQVSQGGIATGSTPKSVTPQEQALVDKYLAEDTSDHASRNMTELMSSQGFTNTDAATRSASINAIGHHASDTPFRRGVTRLLNDPQFQALSPAEKGKAIQTYDQFASSASSSAYGGHNKFRKAAILDGLKTVVTSPGFHKMAPVSQEAMLSVVGNKDERTWGSTESTTKNVAQLVNSAGFQGANSQTQVKWLEGLGAQAGYASSRLFGGSDHNVVANYQFGNDKVEFLGTWNKDNQKLEITATYTGLGGIQRSASLGQYDIDPMKEVNLKVEANAQDGKSLSLSLQNGGQAITINHETSYRRENGLTTQYHRFTAPNGKGELSLYPNKQIAFPNDPKPVTTDEQPRYDADTENTLARASVGALPDGPVKSDIIKDLNSGQLLTAEQAVRLNASAYKTTQTFKILDNLDQMAHPPSVKAEIHAEIEDTRQKMVAALKASYGADSKAYETARTEAEQSQASLQARIATHYAQAVQNQIDEKDALESATRAAQAQEGGESGDYWRAETNRRLGVEVGSDGQPIQTAAAKDKVELEGLRKDLELGDNNQASNKIFALYEKNQRDIQELSVMAMQAQAHRYKKDLNSVFDKYLLPGKSRTPHAQSYDNEFNGYLQNLDAAEAEGAQAEKQYAEAKTPEERDAALKAYSAAEKKRNDTYSAFLKTVSSPQFARDISKIQNRIGKVEFARTTSIVLASAAAGGIVGQGARMAVGAVAGRIVGTVNAGRIATAGAFLAETTTFTATERALSNAPHGTFTKDLLTNFAMFGAMKGAGKWYEHSFKAAEGTSPILYHTGQIGSEIVAAHTTNEVAFRFENGHFMDGNNRLQSLLTAGVLVPGLHAGAWGTKKAVGKVVGWGNSVHLKAELTKQGLNRREADIVASLGEDAVRKALAEGETAASLVQKAKVPDFFDDLATRSSQRELDPIPGSKLTSKADGFVTVGKHGDLNALPNGVHGDNGTKLLWTVDKEGAHFVPETKTWDSSRRMPSHTNISDDAYFAGEAWRTGTNEITINSGSRAFGYNWQTGKKLTGAEKSAYMAEMQSRYNRATEYFESLGLKVKVMPLGER
jgi:hypothetical protein